MAFYFTDKTEKGIQLLWMQHNLEKLLEGKHLLQEAAEEGDGDAYCFLARTYMGEGYVWQAAGLGTDEDMAAALLRKSIKEGSSCGVLTAMEWGALVDREPDALLKSAYETVLKYGEEGHPFCQYLIGSVYTRWKKYFPGSMESLADLRDIIGLWQEGIGEDSAEKEAEALLETMEERAWFWNERALYSGVTIALMNLQSLPRDDAEFPEKGRRWDRGLQFAAEQGDPLWQKIYAIRLYQKERYEEALSWYERAAMGGEAEAWYDVAYQYEIGQGTLQDERKAAWAYGQGAFSGLEECFLPYGKHLLFGRGVDKDPYQAYQWFSKEAEEEKEMASLYRGHCLFRGLGVRQNVDEGIRLLLDALEYDFPEDGTLSEPRLDFEERCVLYLDLGDACEQGLGVPKNENNAGCYFSALAQEGNEEGILRLSSYRKTLFRRWKKKEEKLPKKSYQEPTPQELPMKFSPQEETTSPETAYLEKTAFLDTAPPGEMEHPKQKPNSAPCDSAFQLPISVHFRRRRPGRMLGTPCYRIHY